MYFGLHSPRAAFSASSFLLATFLTRRLSVFVSLLGFIFLSKGIIFTCPPLAVTASSADFEAAATSKVIFCEVIFPFANNRTGKFARTSPAWCSISLDIILLSVIFFSLIARCTAPRFTIAQVLRKIFVNPLLGKRRYMGICPPSNPLMETPERDFCPLCPLPAVLPKPEPIPRPLRFRAWRAPLLSLRSFSFITMIHSFVTFMLRLFFVIFDVYQVRDDIHHSSNGWSIW